MLKVYRICTDTCAVNKPNFPAFVTSRFQTANDTPPTVEVRGAAKSGQANIKLKAQNKKYPARGFVIEGM
jgi:hypothetical protein